MAVGLIGCQTLYLVHVTVTSNATEIWIFVSARLHQETTIDAEI